MSEIPEPVTDELPPLTPAGPDVVLVPAIPPSPTTIVKTSDDAANDSNST
jgi:hypothetical protein